MKLGIDPVHFGIIMVVNMEVGMCHPPVGLNLYVASGITKMGITELTVAVWPWLLTMLGFLMVVTYWPSLSIWLPEDAGHDVAPLNCGPTTLKRSKSAGTPPVQKAATRLGSGFFTPDSIAEHDPATLGSCQFC